MIKRNKDKRKREQQRRKGKIWKTKEEQRVREKKTSRVARVKEENFRVRMQNGEGKEDKKINMIKHKREEEEMQDG